MLFTPTFIVGGYLVTKHFSVFLPSLNKVVTVAYDLGKREDTAREQVAVEVVWHK